MFVRITSKRMLDEIHAKEFSEDEKLLIKFKRIEKFTPVEDRKLLWEVFNKAFPEMEFPFEKESIKIKSSL